MKTLLFIYLFVLSNLQSFSQNVDWQWVKTAIAFDAGIMSIVSDKDAKLYIAGGFEGSPAYFGNIQLNNSNLNQVTAIVAKYDSSGNAIWAACGGGFRAASIAAVYGITLDKTGHCYVTGIISDTSVFGLDTLIGHGWYDFFVAKYDTSGNLVWIRSTGSNNQLYDEARSIVADSIGNSYVTGYFSGTAIFENDTLTSYGNKDFFLAAYDPNGNLRWVKQGGGNSIDVGEGVSIIGNKIYVAGHFYRTAVFDTDTVTSNSLSSDIFIAVYDTSGQIKNLKIAGGPKADEAHAIAIDKMGNCYITGFSSDTAVFGIDTVTGNGVFLSKCDSSLNFLWTRHENPAPLFASENLGEGIFVNESGDCYLSGSYRDTIIFGYDTLVSFDIVGNFVFKVNPSGNLLWKISASSNGSSCRGITSDADGNCFVGGKGAGFQFGSIPVFSGMFLAKIGCIASQPEITYSNDSLYSTGATSYQWFFNGNIIPGATAQFYSPQLNGEYIVKTKDADGCTAYSLPYNYTGVGILETENGNLISVSKNPSGDYLFVSINSMDAIRRIAIINALGKTILYSSFSKINLSECSWGVYFYSVETKSGKLIRGKILKTD